MTLFKRHTGLKMNMQFGPIPTTATGKIERLDQIGSSPYHFYTTSGPPCPDSQSTEWIIYYNSEWIPAYGFINVTAQRNSESQIP